MTEREAMAREIAADRYENGSNFGPQRETFRAGWEAAMEYVSSVSRLPPEYSTMRVLLEYPNPIGLHPNEARWRDFARALINVPNQKQINTDPS